MSDDDLNNSVGGDDEGDLNEIWEESDFSVAESAGTHDSSFSSIVSSIPAASTPKNRKKKKKEQDVFKKPAAPTKVFAKCTRPGCKKSYKTPKGFNNPLTKHRLQDLASRFCGKNELMRRLHEGVDNNLCIIAKQTQRRGVVVPFILLVREKLHTKEWGNFLQEVLSVVEEGLGDDRSLVSMPTAIQSSLLRTSSKCLCDKKLADSLYEQLNLVAPCDKNIFSLFLNDLLFDLIESAVVLFCQEMLSALPAPRASSLLTIGDDIFPMQVLHHVAGFALYHHISHANKYPKNEKLLRMKSCINKNFVQEGNPPEIIDIEDKRRLSHYLKRKKLIFVSEEAFPFFIDLSEILLASVERDGSVLIAKVLEKVVKNSKMIGLFGSIVNELLSEAETFDLMFKIVKVVARTFKKGNQLRLMNVISNMGKANKDSLAVGHRAKLL